MSKVLILANGKNYYNNQPLVDIGNGYKECPDCGLSWNEFIDLNDSRCITCERDEFNLWVSQTRREQNGQVEEESPRPNADRES